MGAAVLVTAAFLHLSPPPVILAQAPGESPGAPKPTADSTMPGVPPWALNARWFQIDVPEFVNGEPANDLASPGGDFQGLRSRLEYFKTLGVDVLYLTSVFPPKPGAEGVVNWLHVDPTLTVKAPETASPEPPPNRHKTAFTPGDRVFLAFLEAAHQSGIRVIVDLGVGETTNSLGSASEAVKDLTELARRWMDPRGDGKTAEGVDGWVVRNADRLPRDFVKEWRTKLRSWNPAALLVAGIDGDPSPSVGGGGFDAWVNHDMAEAVRQFIGVAPAPMIVKPFLAKLEPLTKGEMGDALLASPIPLSVPRSGRFRQAVKPTASGLAGGAEAKSSAQPAAAEKPSDDPASRWQLATILQHFLPGAPMTSLGDETLSSGGPVESAAGSERTPDAMSGAATPAEADQVLASLIQWLNTRRLVDAPLRAGVLRVVLVDEERKVLALARTLPGDEVILVMNFGDVQQRVMVPAGKPGQLAAMLSLALDTDKLPPALAQMNPPPKDGVQPLRMVGSRQLVDVNGQARVWVKPMSARYVLLQDR